MIRVQFLAPVVAAAGLALLVGCQKAEPDVVASTQVEQDHANHSHARMPRVKKDPEWEKDVFLKPGGIYTEADIQANGNVLPSAKYEGINWPHDDLEPGDKTCPVTSNKADDRCEWIVNGKKYVFCCTPCLTKFVTWAKEQPEKIKDPSEYVNK